MSARDQLERLLYVLAEATRVNGARVEDLARALDVSPSEVLRDIEEATAREYFHPAGAVHPFEITVDGDVVRVHSSREFQRPVRLSSPEAMALGLGLRVLAAEAEPQRRAAILALAMRLEKELVSPAAADVQPLEVVFGEDDYRGIITEAIDAQTWCDVLYLRAGGSEPAQRRIAPMRLLFGNGHWYLSAIENGSDERRVYRLDRMLDVTKTAESFDYEQERAASASTFASNGGKSVSVRYSARVARWIAERQNAQCEADGTLMLTYDVADMNWLVRHILQYAGEAVVETPEARRTVAALAARMAK